MYGGKVAVYKKGKNKITDFKVGDAVLFANNKLAIVTKQTKKQSKLFPNKHGLTFKMIGNSPLCK